ncbi:uncharacterized protein LOC119603334 [Lucilia sericata]|uniref:uncharacterized protein LOC119603334 n=1 Tax=Lucilia sericata TaxID=13632 RepID=UPI0018A7EC48|nr:uncharacterized protein LOC119603334 [Lucilia sericata]
MLNKKSFDLYKDEKKTKTTERLYQPKKFRWCKYIVLPLLFGFVLLLILTNVDFTGEAYNKNQNFRQENTIMFSPDQTLQPNVGMYSSDKTILGSLGQIKSSISRALNCIQSTDSCSLTCVGGNINNIYKQLEQLYKSCNKDLDLILIDCSLPSGRLKASFFQGNYYLKTINITNCNLAVIDNKAFAQESVKNLRNLTLINTSFPTLDMTAFEGLQQLEYFQLVNKISWSTFKGDGFLFYFSDTLTSLVIQQEASKSTVYDPLSWLQGATMERLTSVNLSNNNFQNILHSKTFATLTAVQYLDLSYCSLTFLEAKTFDSILKTLKHLDLSNNHLSSVPGEMLRHMNGLELNLSFNYWLCTCDNKEMLQIIKWKLVDLQLLDETNIKCYTPMEWQDVPVDDLVLDCLVSTTLGISWTTNGEITEEETEITSETTTTPTQCPDNSTITTVTSGEISSSSDSSNESSSSSHTSEETNETSSESIETTTEIFTTTTPKPTLSTTTKRTTIFYTTTTTSRPTTSRPLTPISCSNKRAHLLIVEAKCHFFIKPISATAIKIVTNTFLTNMSVIYFHDARNNTVISNMQEYFTIINNLNSSEIYVFCLIWHKFKNGKIIYDWKISPFDCRSYSHADVLPQPWLEKEDQIWIICLVVLGSCLMVFLGIILVVLIRRWKNDYKSKYERTFNRDSESEPNYLEPTANMSHQNCDVIVRPFARLYVSRHQPPDVAAQHINCVLNHDLYEELIL